MNSTCLEVVIVEKVETVEKVERVEKVDSSLSLGQWSFASHRPPRPVDFALRDCVLSTETNIDHPACSVQGVFVLVCLFLIFFI